MKSVLFCTIICIALGYFVGGLNPAYLLARLKGFDIRERGSGNAGASNAIITMGKLAGVLIAFFDIAKAYYVVKLSRFLFPELTYAAEITGVAVMLGHIFPVMMGFRGGKGLACLGGVVLSFDKKIFLVMLLIELVLALILDYICVVPITASTAFPFVYYSITGSLVGALLYASAAPVFLYKHLENLKRIRMGTELHFSYLWNKEKEIQRVMEASGK